MNWQSTAVRLGLAAFFVAGIASMAVVYNDFKQGRARGVEAQRVHCLDHFCDGDVDPRRDYTKDELLKFNGQWYLGPKYYFSSGMNGAAFYWPSKKNREDVPMEERAVVGAHTIEIFLTGRARWPEPNVERPWELNRDIPLHWKTLTAKGLVLQRRQIQSGLERVEFIDQDGKRDHYVYFVATNTKYIRGNGSPILSCRMSEPSRPEDRCFGGEYWQADILADFRFSAKHAADWPAIHQEITRVLNLLKKVTP